MRRRWPYGRAAAEAAVAAAASFEEAARRRIALSEVHVDPLVRPVAVEPEVGAWFLEAVRTLRTTNGTGIHLTGGLSNVSFGLPNRRLLNDVFVALAIDAGVHSAIVDPIATGLARIAATDRAGRAFRLAADVLTGPTRMPMEIVIVAAGRPGLITGDMLRPRAVVVDVGINVRKGRIVGDVDAASAGPVVSAIAPVPGGVGPLTNAILLTHLMRAARNQAEGQVTLGSRSMAPTLQVESVPMGFPSDLEIARSVTPRPIVEVARAIGLREDEIELYGSFKAKVTLDGLRRVEAESPRGKYVLVTAITPTPLGEGKTTVTVGLAQGLNRIGHQAAVTIRQPSLGPVFGIKGGAAGGGYSQIIPMEDFNLHLTGDVHAIGAAHNLAAAFLDNSLHHGNPLGIDQHAILWPHVVDISDRALRHAIIGLGGREDGVPRETEWVITVASEVMAILALASDLRDLRERLGRIVVARTLDGRPVTAEDIKVAGAMAVLLRDAIKPNLLQTLEGGPAFVHCGPFANIAHGNSSILADRVALATNEIVCTEAGFGADMGAEKFFDIKCRASGLRPDAAVVVATVRALKMHGGVGRIVAGRPLDPALLEENVEAVRRGAANLAAHVEIVRKYGVPVIVAMNAFPTDTDAEYTVIREISLAAGARDAVVTRNFADGGAGAEDLARAVWAAAEEGAPGFRFLYPDAMPLREKIETIAREVYGADGVDFAPSATKKLADYEVLGYGSLPVCMAKTHLSLSHEASLKGRPTGFRFPVRDVRLSAGAGFIYPLAGDMRTMPGLPSKPAGDAIDIDANGDVVGLF